MPQKWTRLAITIDSGACDNVADPEQLPTVGLVQTKESLSGEGDFQSATGEPIANLGEMKVPMITRENTLRGMKFTGAPVTKPLRSLASRRCQRRQGGTLSRREVVGGGTEM